MSAPGTTLLRRPARPAAPPPPAAHPGGSAGHGAGGGHAPLGGQVFTPLFMLLAMLGSIALGILGMRFVLGIGAVTNVNDGYPWGIWVVIDVVIGTALGCAGYAVALLIYLFNRGSYHPMMRPALMAGLFGYTLGGAAVMFDLGRYWNTWHLFWPWHAQPNSVMWEIALCVTTYIIVLWIEFTPAFLERFGLHRVRRWLNRVLFVFIALGVLLPTMHQSSLGTVLVVLGNQISPLWQTNLLPLLFLMSALLLGYAIVVFEAVLSSAGFKRPMEGEILAKLSQVMWWLLAAFLAVRLGDLTLRVEWGLAFAGSRDAVMFWIEIALHLVPLVILATRAGRTSPRWMFVAATAMLLGGFVYRINAYLVGYHPAGISWHYFPSVPEILVTIGIFSIEILAYLMFVKLLPVLHAPAAQPAAARSIRNTYQQAQDVRLKAPAE